MLFHPFTIIFYLGLHKKQKALEAENVRVEMKCEAQKKVLAEELNNLQAVKEETKNVEAKI